MFDELKKKCAALNENGDILCLYSIKLCEAKLYTVCDRRSDITLIEFEMKRKSIEA